jgi:pSer/pThr/pTyr-binding forkhead associated (FHA) protein
LPEQEPLPPPATPAPPAGLVAPTTPPARQTPIVSTTPTPSPAAALPKAKPPALRQAEEVAIPRPRYRPPTAILQILDDGRKSAEVLRLRSESCVIGRTEGDVKITHDLQISTRHAEITRVLNDGKYTWRLRDLASTNGTYVRVKAALLANDQEIIVGQHRFRFAEATPGTDGEAQEEQPPLETDIRKTCTWQLAETSLFPLKRREGPQLVELLTDGEGRHFPLAHEEDGAAWLGRDSSLGALAFPEDMTMNPRHARLYRDRKDRWRIEDSGSQNGVWLRVNEMLLTTQASFLLGEQVFVIFFP